MTGMPPNVLKGRLTFTVLPQVWGPPVRPRDCAEGDAPCPWRECPYAIDNQAHPEVTCAIDVADEEESLTQVYVARVMGVSQQAVAKLESKGVRKIKHHPEGLHALAMLRGRGL